MIAENVLILHAHVNPALKVSYQGDEASHLNTRPNITYYSSTPMIAESLFYQDFLFALLNFVPPFFTSTTISWKRDVSANSYAGECD